MNSQPIIIGAGHRARQGKDYACSYLQNIYPNTYLLHWADSLYEEVTNKDRENLLIEYQIPENIYKIYNGKSFDYCTPEEVPELHHLFAERNITEYAGMDEKDSPMLQWWGTNYRRHKYGEDYWVNRTIDKIEEISKSHHSNLWGRPVVLIADTRFPNELAAIKLMNGYYIELERWENGERYYAKDRDPNHPSECSLDNCFYDYLISAESGQTNLIEDAIEEIFHDILAKANPASVGKATYFSSEED